jgi:hypothetical protein
MRASFDPRPIQTKSEDELLQNVVEKIPPGAPGSSESEPVAKARAYVNSFGDGLRARLGPEREQITKLTFEQQVHYLGRVLGLEMKAAATQWIALIYVKRGLDSFCSA